MFIGDYWWQWRGVEVGACRGVWGDGGQESLVELRPVVAREEEEDVLTENLQNLAAREDAEQFDYIDITQKSSIESGNSQTWQLISLACQSNDLNKVNYAKHIGS